MFTWKSLEELNPLRHMHDTLLLYVCFPDPDEPESEIYAYELGTLSRCSETGNIDAINTDVDSYALWMGEWVSHENADEKVILNWCVVEPPEAD